MRFVNHSCEPNSILEKWNIAGEERCGIFALRDVDAFEEITFYYKVDFLHGDVSSRSNLMAVAAQLRMIC